MFEKKSQLRERICLFVLALLTIVGFESSAMAQQASWQVALEEGKTASSTLVLNNRCRAPHTFRVKEDIKYLSFQESTESILIVPGAGKSIGVKFDSTGLKPKVYQDEIIIECLDCKTEKTCTQDKDKVPVQLTVTKPSGSKNMLPTTSSQTTTPTTTTTKSSANFVANFILICRTGDPRTKCTGFGNALCLGFPEPPDIASGWDKWARNGWVQGMATLNDNIMEMEFSEKFEQSPKTMSVEEDIVFSEKESANIGAKSLTVLKGVYDVDYTNPSAPKMSLNVRVVPKQNSALVPSTENYLKLTNLANDINRYTLLADTLEATLFSDRALSPIEENSSRQNSIAISREMLEIVNRIEKTASELKKYQTAVNEQMIKSGLEKSTYIPSAGKFQPLSSDNINTVLNKWTELNKNGEGLISLSQQITSGASLQTQSIKNLISELEKNPLPPNDRSKNQMSLRKIWGKIVTWVMKHPCDTGLIMVIVGTLIENGALIQGGVAMMIKRC